LRADKTLQHNVRGKKPSEQHCVKKASGGHFEKSPIQNKVALGNPHHPNGGYTDNEN
jgi:hypothetical protein